jgi:hypothetical protein
MFRLLIEKAFGSTSLNDTTAQPAVSVDFLRESVAYSALLLSDSSEGTTPSFAEFVQDTRGSAVASDERYLRTPDGQAKRSAASITREYVADPA